MCASLICIEGPQGVGKSSLAAKVSERYGYHLELEIFEDNPFLARHFGLGEKCAFQSEMFFLASRYKQLLRLRKDFLDQGDPSVADFHFLKNPVLARLVLEDEEFSIFEQLYEIVSKELPPVELMIFLNGNPKTIHSRLLKRGRPFEQNLSLDYLAEVCNAYALEAERYKISYPKMKVLIIDTNDTDFVENHQHLEVILHQIDASLKAQ